MILHEHTFRGSRALFRLQLRSVVLQAEWNLLRMVKKKERGGGVGYYLAFSSTVFTSQSVSQSVASHQARINPPPRSLLSRQTVTDVLRYRAIIYQPPRLFNPWRFTRQRHGKRLRVRSIVKVRNSNKCQTRPDTEHKHSARGGLTRKQHCCYTDDTRSCIILYHDKMCGLTTWYNILSL